MHQAIAVAIASAFHRQLAFARFRRRRIFSESHRGKPSKSLAFSDRNKHRRKDGVWRPQKVRLVFLVPISSKGHDRVWTNWGGAQYNRWGGGPKTGFGEGSSGMFSALLSFPPPLCRCLIWCSFLGRITSSCSRRDRNRSRNAIAASARRFPGRIGPAFLAE